MDNTEAKLVMANGLIECMKFKLGAMQQVIGKYKAENAKLRKALQEIAHFFGCPECGNVRTADIAEQALKDSE